MANVVSLSEQCEACRNSITNFCSLDSTCLHLSCMPQVSNLVIPARHGPSELRELQLFGNDKAVTLLPGSTHDETSTVEPVIKNKKKSRKARHLILDISSSTTSWSDSSSRLTLAEDFVMGLAASSATAVDISIQDAKEVQREREARVLRYKEKKKKRKFEKRISYATRKAHADMRPRIRGRFTKKGSESSQTTAPPEHNSEKLSIGWFHP